MGPLSGIRVLDLTIVVQGPQAGQLLVDLGADVVKIELPGIGDLARLLPISATDRRSGFFWACNRGKRSVTLDLRTEGGRRALLKLAESADIVMSNFKPGTMESWGLGYDDVRAVRPDVIYATASAFGPLGPDAEREGADLVGQAAGGLISTTNSKGQAPTPVGAVIADHSGSQNLVSGILAALVHRLRTGEGQQLDVSLLGAMIWAQACEYSYYLLSGEVPGPSNRGHSMIRANYRIYPTLDGWVAMVGVPLPLWPAFCDAIERPDLKEDPRFASYAIAPDDLAELFKILDAEFARRTTADWCARLRETGQRFAPVNDYADVCADPQAWANGYFAEARDDDGELRRVVGNPIRFTATPMRVFAAPPELGQHTEEVLVEAGYSWEEIGELRAQGAF